MVVWGGWAGGGLVVVDHAPGGDRLRPSDLVTSTHRTHATPWVAATRACTWTTDSEVRSRLRVTCRWWMLLLLEACSDGRARRPGTSPVTVPLTVFKFSPGGWLMREVKPAGAGFPPPPYSSPLASTSGSLRRSINSVIRRWRACVVG